MNCDDVHKGIYVYLDDELVESDRLDFERHAQSCPRCRAAIETKRRFIATLRTGLPSTELPDGLEARLRQALADAPAPVRARSQPRPPRVALYAALSAAAAVAVTLLVVGPTSLASPSSDDRLTSEAVATHRDDLPMEVRGSQRQIVAYLDANVPFEVDLPHAPPANDVTVTLVGARLTRVDGREAVLVNYLINGERVSLLQVAAPPQDDAPADHAPTLITRSGFEIAIFRRGGVVNSVVGDRGSPNVGRLANAAWQL